MRLVGECVYRAGSWERERRVVYKGEVMREGELPPSFGPIRM